jgi:hypothetical protein
VDTAGIESAIASAFAGQTSAIRARAQDLYDAYVQALGQQLDVQASTIKNVLAHRVDDAYAARLQLYNERENDAYVARESALADRQLQLRIKLAGLAHTAAEQRALQAQLGAIDRSLVTSADADRAGDAAALAAYRRSLEAAASDEYTATLADLRHTAKTNLALGRAVIGTEQNAAPALVVNFDAPLRAAMTTGASSVLAVQASQGISAKETEAAFTASGSDIAKRLSVIGTLDAANTMSVRVQLTQMQRARAALAAAAAKNPCTRETRPSSPP